MRGAAIVPRSVKQGEDRATAPTPEAVNSEYLRESDHQTRCPWKGMASYYNVDVNGEVNENAAWYYPDPSTAASHIKDHVAFWKGVTVEQ